MRVTPVLGSLLVLSACGGEVPSDERAGRARLPTEALGEEGGGSLGPNPRSLGSRTSGELGPEEQPASPPGVAPAPVLEGSLYAIGGDDRLYRIDLATPSVVPVDHFWSTFPWWDCEGNPVVGESRFSANDLVVDPQRRLIVAGQLRGERGALPSTVPLGVLSVADAFTAEMGDVVVRLPIVPEGLAFTSEGWLAVVGDGLLEVDLVGQRPIAYRVAPGRFRATGGLIELDGKLVFPIQPSGHATYDLTTRELSTFESSFDARYQGLVLLNGSAHALLTDGRVMPIDGSGQPAGSPLMLANAWYGAAIAD